MAVSLPGPVLAGNPYPRRPERGPGGGEGGAAGDASGYRYWLPAGPLPCCAAQHPPLTAGRQRVRALRVLSLLPGRKREHATLLKLRRGTAASGSASERAHSNVCTQAAYWSNRPLHNTTPHFFNVAPGGRSGIFCAGFTSQRAGAAAAAAAGFSSALAFVFFPLTLRTPSPVQWRKTRRKPRGLEQTDADDSVQRCSRAGKGRRNNIRRSTAHCCI